VAGPRSRSLIRIPFLNQAIQGDDDIYITEAAHAQIDPLHPADTHYVFRGDDVDLARPVAPATQRMAAGAAGSRVRRRERDPLSRGVRGVFR